MGPPTPLQATGGSAIGEVPGQAIAWSRPKAARDVREYLPIQELQEAPREIDVPSGSQGRTPLAGLHGSAEF